MENKRKTAKKLFVNDILTSTYIKRPGWEPSGIITRYGEISRVNIVGVIVSKEENDNNILFILDDGTGNIQIRMFEPTEEAKSLSLGDLVTVIGRPREWESSKYIVPEIIKKLPDKDWYKVHQLEVKLKRKTTKKLPVDIEEESPEQEFETGPYQKILNAISILDDGGGVDIQDIVSNIKIKNCDRIVRNLIEEGEIFEISPGKVKLLE